jgi:gas vesicle protein
MLKIPISTIMVFAGITLATGLTVSMAAEETLGQKTKDAVEDVKENTKEMGRDAVKTTKKVGRSIKDKTCRLVKGKMQCAAEKVGHEIQNSVDEIKDKADDVKK